MRKIFEECDGNSTIELSRGTDTFHIEITNPDDKSMNTELIFNKNTILEIISELSKLLIEK